MPWRTGALRLRSCQPPPDDGSASGLPVNRTSFVTLWCLWGCALTSASAVTVLPPHAPEDHVVERPDHEARDQVRARRAGLLPEKPRHDQQYDERHASSDDPQIHEVIE